MIILGKSIVTSKNTLAQYGHGLGEAIPELNTKGEIWELRLLDYETYCAGRIMP